MYLLYADFNCTGTSGITCCIGHLVHDRSLISHAWTWISAHAHLFGEWLKQPRKIMMARSNVKAELMSSVDVLAVIFAWWITFTVIVTIVLALGFGPMGVGAGKTSACLACNRKGL